MARPRSEEKQRAILQATIDLIAEQGLTNLATARIAKQAGVAEGTIFHYFDNKDNLLKQVFFYIKGEIGLALGYIQKQDDFTIYLKEVWYAYIKWGCRFPNNNKALYQLFSTGTLTQETFEEAKSIQPDVDLGLTTSDNPAFGSDSAFFESVFQSIANTVISFCIQEPDKANYYTNMGYQMLLTAYQNH